MNTEKFKTCQNDFYECRRRPLDLNGTLGKWD